MPCKSSWDPSNPIYSKSKSSWLFKMAKDHKYKDKDDYKDEEKDKDKDKDKDKENN